MIQDPCIIPWEMNGEKESPIHPFSHFKEHFIIFLAPSIYLDPHPKENGVFSWPGPILHPSVGEIRSVISVLSCRQTNRPTDKENNTA